MSYSCLHPPACMHHAGSIPTAARRCNLAAPLPLSLPPLRSTSQNRLPDTVLRMPGGPSPRPPCCSLRLAGAGLWGMNTRTTAGRVQTLLLQATQTHTHCMRSPAVLRRLPARSCTHRHSSCSTHRSCSSHRHGSCVCPGHMKRGNLQGRTCRHRLSLLGTARCA